MQKKKKHECARLLILCSLMYITACQERVGSDAEMKPFYTAALTELSDAEYPDNPDIGYRSTDYRFDYLHRWDMRPGLQGDWAISISIGDGGSNEQDSIHISNFSIEEFIPAIPAYAYEDEYLAYIALVNQEWNRNQVRLDSGMFHSTDERIVRIDIARNCLNAYLWEIILFVREENEVLPFAHAWFDFPEELYRQLFEQRNGRLFADYAEALEHWTDPPNKPIDASQIRVVVGHEAYAVKDLSDNMYPVEGERKRKYKEIVYPTAFKSMRDLQHDSTQFATFSPPGIYNTSDPRKTELGRFATLDSASVYRIVPSAASISDTLWEIRMHFKHRKTDEITRLVVGGIDLEALPHLAPADANNGWMRSMGFGNHTFYESYADHLACKADEDPYYAYLTDGGGNWLDSHEVGIDGPLMHIDANQPEVVHLWLLSFERHALVGHYAFSGKKEGMSASK